jgi:hypothetical protein
VDKRSPKIWPSSLDNLKKLPKENNRPKGRKFAQSSRPGWNEPRKKIFFSLYPSAGRPSQLKS